MVYSQVKSFFSNSTTENLAEQINEWANSNNIEIINISHTYTIKVADKNTYVFITALVVYNKRKT